MAPMVSPRTVNGSVINKVAALGGTGTEFIIDDTAVLSENNAALFAWKRQGSPRFRMFLDGSESSSNNGSDWTVAR